MKQAPLREGTGIAVVGTQWGDEGKGKVVDLLAATADVVARFQGGPNAGHTVQVDGRKFQLHHVPSGALHEQAACVIGNGVVLLPESFREEMRILAEAGVRLEGRLFLSNHAHVILPSHVAADHAGEDAPGGIGTTRRGVGPCYEAKAGRRGVRVEDLLDDARLRRRAAEASGPGREAETTRVLEEFIDEVRPYVADTAALLNWRMDEGARVLFEGAQGTMLDVDHGTYPFVTSSNSSAGGICAGLGVGPTRVGGVVGVMKAYSTRVGKGPLATELTDEVGDRIRERGREYGTTTGRPRRCGWLDGVVVRHAARINRLDTVALTLLDVLDEFETLRVCTSYRLRGAQIDELPLESWALDEVEPVYAELPGWRTPTGGARHFDDLPPRARDYVRLVEDLAGCEVGLISVGPGREQSILRAGSRLLGWMPDPAPHAGGSARPARRRG